MFDPIRTLFKTGARQACLLAGLFFLLACRMLAMAFIPLNDTTEARYAEIARKMLETGNWVTPQHDYGIPFWAKPPLSTWLSAFSMKLFGVNEFAARLPSLLLSIGVLCLIWRMAKKRTDSVGWNAVLVLSTCAFFILDSGTVMTDPSLLFCITLGMAAFWLAVVENQARWGYLFFAGLGLGLLAKGPIALVLTGMPLFFWVLIRNQWRALWSKLPWISGSLLMLAIALPWYLLAESRTPGFLNYFIVGEHIHRFLDPSWTGDKYGFAHVTRPGMIWVYAIAAIFPWVVGVFFYLFRYRKSLPSLCRDEAGWVSYLLLFALVPLIFFTFARNIIYPYVFPSLPAFALVFAELARRTRLSERVTGWFVVLAGGMGVLMLVAVALFSVGPKWVAKSQKPVIAAWRQQNPLPESQLIYWADKSNFSAQFYSRGRVKATLDPATLCQLLSKAPGNYLVLNSRIPRPLPQAVQTQLSEVASIQVLQETLTLYRADEVHCQAMV